MKSYAFILNVKAGCEEEYERRHDEIWPEMTEFLTEAGFQNYHIYRHGLDLFGYFECEDLDAIKRISAASDVNKRWGAYMTEVMDLDPDMDFPPLLPEMFFHK